MPDPINIDSKLMGAQVPQEIPEENPLVPQEVKQAEPEKVETPTSDYDVEAPSENEEAKDLSEDEYGNKAQKEKYYSEEEVQRMIRDRLSRGRHAEERAPEQSVQPEVQQGEEGWEQQLESFIDQTLEKRTKKQQEEAWRNAEKKRQSEFESKFSAGMTKYSDFKKVVENQPITDTMMLSMRSMKDPAAFLYAASKTQPKELERIARLEDPLMQAAELGRLDATMRRSKGSATNAPKPATISSGDASGHAKRSIDDLIRIDAERRRRR